LPFLKDECIYSGYLASPILRMISMYEEDEEWDDEEDEDEDW